MSQTVAVSVPLEEEGPWLLSRRWDLVFLIGSAILVPLPLIIKNGFGFSVAAVNIVVTILIGGPHLFSTFSYTLLERSFWRRHPFYASGAMLIPPFVIFMGLNHFPILISIFFFWASIHILHQVCYLVDCYQKRSGVPSRLWVRAVDYAVVFTSIYPIASRKLVDGTFAVAGVNMRLPFVYGNEAAFYLMTSLFAVSLALFLGKTLWEIRAGTVIVPKTLLIGVTVLVSFLLPIPQDLDVVFQGFNTWHSLQYIALAWWINVLRKERDEIGSTVIQRVTGRDRKTLFYLSCLVPTILFLILVGIVGRTTGLPHNQSYFMVVLSGLLTHYYFDHWVFTKVEAVVPESAPDLA